MEKSQRKDYLDTISGIFILFMVILHWKEHLLWLNPLYQFLECFLYFFMAWFFFKSGFVFNNTRNFSETMRGSIRRLLVPYFIYSVLGYAIWGIRLLLENNLHINYLYIWVAEIIWKGAIWTNGPLWYLIGLFIIRLLYSLIGNNQRYVLLCTVAMCAIAIAMHNYRVDIPIMCYNIPLGAFFFGLGLILSKYDSLLKNRTIIYLCSTIFIFAMMVCPSTVSVYENKLCQGYYSVWLFSSFSGIVLFLNLFKKLPTCVPLCWVGRHTMPILVFHMPIMSVYLIIHDFFLN